MGKKKTGYLDASMEVAKRGAFGAAVAGFGYLGAEYGTDLVGRIEAIGKLYIGDEPWKEGVARTIVGTAIAAVPAIGIGFARSPEAGIMVGSLMGIGVFAAAWGETTMSYARELGDTVMEALGGEGGPETRATRELAAKTRRITRGRGAHRRQMTGGERGMSESLVGGVETTVSGRGRQRRGRGRRQYGTGAGYSSSSTIVNPGSPLMAFGVN